MNRRALLSLATLTALATLTGCSTQHPHPAAVGTPTSSATSTSAEQNAKPGQSGLVPGGGTPIATGPAVAPKHAPAFHPEKLTITYQGHQISGTELTALQARHKALNLVLDPALVGGANHAMAFDTAAQMNTWLTSQATKPTPAAATGTPKVLASPTPGATFTLGTIPAHK